MNTTLRTNTDNGDKGFTLIEVLIALAIFSIGILAVASLQVTAVLQSRNSSEITRAYEIASTQMEELMQLPFIDLVSNPLHPYPQENKYSIEWAVTASTLNGLPIKTVNLTVSCDKLVSSSKREVSLSFIKHDPNPPQPT